MKNKPRERRRSEMEEDKEADRLNERLEREKLKLEEEIVGMAQEIEHLKGLEDEYLHNRDKLKDLYEQGVIDEDYNPKM
jgi:hypothetical protein